MNETDRQSLLKERLKKPQNLERRFTPLDSGGQMSRLARLKSLDTNLLNPDPDFNEGPWGLTHGSLKQHADLAKKVIPPTPFESKDEPRQKDDKS